MLTRKGFIKLVAAGGATTYLATRGSFLRRAQAAQSPQTPLNPKAIPQFTEELPDLLASNSLIIDDGVNEIPLVMTERLSNVLPAGAVPGYAGTWTWSYIGPGQANRASYLGPVILAFKGVPTQIRFTNSLLTGATTQVLAYKYSTDQTLHWADPLFAQMGREENMWNHMASPPPYLSEGAENYLGPIPACPHLHGGYVPPVLDGGPDSWFTSDGQYIGKGFYSKGWDYINKPPQDYCVYRYPNDQEEALIWFHDHTLGATRLNVYCGMAGGYLILDPDDKVVTTFALDNIVPLVIQDRMFDTNGQFFFPASSSGGFLWALNPEHPYWVPEFIGDTICVNGKAWPKKIVEQRRYLFLCVNGSNARTYELSLTDPVSKNFGPPLYVVGTDGGLLNFPVKLDPASMMNNKLVMMPGERYWVIVDFAGFGAGVKGPNGANYSGKWLMKNTAKSPYPGGDTPQGATTGKVMQFVVQGGPVTDTSYNPATNLKLREPMVRLSNGAPVTKTRQLTLNEIALLPRSAVDPVSGNTVLYPGGPVEILVNNTKWDGMRIKGVKTDGMYDMVPIDSSWQTDPAGNYLSEVLGEGETELWEIVNTTMDAHPIHTHLAQFQLVSRQAYDAKKYFAAYSAAFPRAYDYTLKADSGPGLFIPAYGPPLAYTPTPGGKFGGNPNVDPFLKGPVQLPLPQENGWKDTVVSLPGMVTRFLVRWGPQDKPADTPAAGCAFPFDPYVLQGGYVWHCHIVDHEDNEMMRPDAVSPLPNINRTYNIGTDY